MAAAGSADASIIYVNPTVKPTATLSAHTVSAFNIAPGGAVPASVKLQHFAGNYRGTYAFAKAGQGVIGTASNALARQFPKAHNISTQNGGSTPGNGILRGYFKNLFLNTHETIGNFDIGKMEYAGFQMPASKGGGLGWMRVEIFNGANGHPDEVEAIDGAYNDAGGGITAGQGATVPEPSALGLLAMGAMGVMAWRRRRPVSKAGLQSE